ncbi:MAG: hypothetical protein IPN27_10020 [Cellvibrionales bacterium]|jgi:uncharacterized membrane protein|nr:hypothetical protein [Cellvibrionales bacterium]HRF87067.1 hypothetical protein [Pseudomonadales bacterium]HRG50908.1 hypothetical protein [Pseudomonadales bacterium]
MPNALLAALALLYPALVYFGLLHFSAQWVGMALAVAMVLRLLLLRNSTSKQLQSSLFPALLLATLCALASAFFNQQSTLKFIPVVINLCCLLGFSITLWRPPSMIERFARLQEPQLSDVAIRYTRKVTMVWCGFFIVNGSIALYTALYADMKTWALYNGLIAYVLMGALFAGEYLVRLRVKAREQQQ